MPLLAVPALVFVAAFMVAYGSSLTVRSWSSGMTKWLGRASWLVERIVPVLGTYELKLVKYIAHELGRFATAAIFAMARWLAGLRQYILVVGFWTLLWPVELYKLASWLVHRYIPKAIEAHTGGVVKVVHGAVKIIRRVETRVVHVTKVVTVGAKAVVIQTVPRTVREATEQIQWLRRHWKALTALVAGAGAVSLPWVRDAPWGVTVRQLRRRLRKLERATVGLGAVALVYAGLRRMGLGALRCTNVKRALRGTCGANPAWLELLFGAGAEAWIVTHLCDFVAELSIAAKAVQPELLAFVALEDALIGCHGASKPPRLSVPRPAVPLAGSTLTLSV